MVENQFSRGGGEKKIRKKRKRKERKRERKGKRKEKEKTKRRESERKKRRREKKKKRKKRKRHFPSRSLVNRRSKGVGARDKVSPCNESYAWVSKSKFFVEALRGRGFSPILVPLYLRAVNGRVVQPKHGIEFSDIGIVFWTVQDWVLKVSIQAGFRFWDGWRCNDFCCELFFGIVFGLSVKTS